ncbi:MAG: SLC26A/SulP transporter family protein [Anaerolineales bacterium]|nr:SLC26A/SulP transporter family protein [Anaerolineales bacterium]
MKFDIKKILPIVSLGVVMGAMGLTTVLSFAILVYSTNELGTFAGAGIGILLFGGMIVQIILALMSSISGVVGGPQDSPIAIMGLVTVTLLAQMADATVEAKFITILTGMMLTTIISGGFFLTMGIFKLGRLVRFIPYPVVGGFIAGTGFLLVQGGFSVMMGMSPSFENFSLFFTSQGLLRWLPSFIFGFILVLGARFYSHFLTLPILLITAIATFYGVAFFNGQTIESLRAGNWLLGPFPEGSLLKPIDLTLFSQVNWEFLAEQSSNLAAVALISMVAMLLNSNAIELIAKKDVDLSRELVATGIANIAGGFFGTSVGYHYLGYTAIPLRMNIHSRWIAIISASVTLFVLLFGAGALSLLPTLISGGILFFLGISFLVDWLYDAWFQLPRVDYLLIVIILAVVAGFGFLQGVGAGIAIAIILFVINYSRIDIVKDTLTGKTYQSKAERPYDHRQLIRLFGDRILILRLQGFVFFGTAQALLQKVQTRLKEKEKEPLRYLILDFHYITNVDSSAVFSFVRLKQLAEADNFNLILADVNIDTKNKLIRAGLTQESAVIHYTENLDFAMDWSETQLLMEDIGSTIIQPSSLAKQLKKIFSSTEAVNQFMKYLEKQEIEAGATLIQRNDLPDGMYFIDSGELDTVLDTSTGKSIRLKNQGGGTMIGEIGLFLKQSRTATVIAKQPSVVYWLSNQNYERMMKDDPDLSFKLHQWIGRVLSVRLAENNHTLEALLG